MSITHTHTQLLLYASYKTKYVVSLKIMMTTGWQYYLSRSDIKQNTMIGQDDWTGWCVK